MRQHFVFLPGTLLDAEQFAPQFRRLSPEHTVCAFEYSRKTDKLSQENLIETWANDTLDFIADIGRPVTLCGHSFGGIIAQIVAVQRPDLVERLVLAETNFCADDSLLGSLTLEMAKVFLRSTPWDKLRNHIINLHGQYSIESKFYLEAALPLEEEHSLARDTMLAALQWDGKERLHDISAPTDIIIGEFFDRTVKQAGQFSELIPNARLHTIEAAGHLVNLDAHMAFNSVLLQSDRAERAA